MIEIFVGAVVLVVVVLSIRRWRQTRRGGPGDGGIGLDEALSFRDQNDRSRRPHDGEYGLGRF